MDDAIDGAQSMVIVGTLRIIDFMELTAQDVPKVILIYSLLDSHLNIFRKYPYLFSQLQIED